MATRAPGDVPTAPSLAVDDLTEEIPAVPGPTPSRWHRRRRWLVVVVAVVVAAGAGVGIWLGTSGGSTTGLKVVTQVVSVTTGTMQQTVSTTGTIAPAQEADLDFAATGKVSAVDVAVGQTVAVGQALATLAPTALQAAVAAAQASLTAAQAKLSGDQADGASTSQILSDEASIASAQSQLNAAQANLTAATLTSTIAGTVASVDLTVGQQVTAGGPAGTSGSSGTSSQVVVVSTGTFVVNATVDDTVVGEIATGDQAVVTPSSSTTKVYGTVASVGMIASGSSGVASFPVVVDVTGTPGGIHAGATADVSIVVRQIDDALQVPTAAISYHGGQATVTVVRDGRHVPTVVTTGQTSNGNTQITRGLSAGEQVVQPVVTFTGTSSTGKSDVLGGPGGRTVHISPGVHISGGPGIKGGGPVGGGTTGGGTGGGTGG